jgi:putative oxidoreductase
MAIYLQGFVSLLGRLMLITIFLMSAVGNKIPNFKSIVDIMAGAHVPYPQYALIGAIAFLIIGSVTVLLGWWGRVGAFLLFVFLCLATYYFHDFWKYQSNSKEFQQQMIQFMKNLSMAGAMLMIMANGTGAWSLSGKRSSPKPKKA